MIFMAGLIIEDSDVCYGWNQLRLIIWRIYRPTDKVRMGDVAKCFYL